MIPLLIPISLPAVILTTSQIASSNITLVWLTMWVFALVYQFNSVRSESLFGLLVIILASVCVCFFCTSNTLSFYLLFEISIPPTLFLILLFGYQPEKLLASSYLVLYTVLSSLPMLLVLLTLPAHLSYIYSSTSLCTILAITFGFIVNTPIYIVHIWLPNAHVEAPVAGSMVLAGVLLKLGSYGLMVFLPVYVHDLLFLYIFLSVVGGVICSCICARQWDANGLIAYSSVVHMGVVSVGLVCGSELGYSCALVIVVAHGVCSPLLFGVAFFLYENSHTRVLSLNRGNLGAPIVTLVIFALLAVNIGVPPFLNVWAEVIMFSALFSFITWSVPFLIPLAFFAVLYNIIIYVMLTHGKESHTNASPISPWHYISSLLLSLVLSCNLNFFLVS